MASCWLVLGASLCAGLAGCVNDTGIIVEVFRSPETRMIERLDFIVGTAADGFWLRDPASSISDVNVAGRNLMRDPYQLLLRDGTSGNGQGLILVAVAGLVGEETVASGAFNAPLAFVPGKVILQTIVLSPDAHVVETSAGCVVWNENAIATPADLDCDGDPASMDCDDRNPQVGPSRPERCGNGINDDCDLMTDELEDKDGDRASNCDDCNDADPTTYPGAQEVCDNKDNDCNEVCDDGVLDADHDRHNVCGEKIRGDGTCEETGAVDCRDNDDKVYPGATEICNGLDDDCDEHCDEELDLDMDGFTPCGTVPELCGTNESLKDCNEETAEVRPFVNEICEGHDTDCDGQRLAQRPCYRRDDLGMCNLGTRACDDDASDGSSGYDPSCATYPSGNSLPGALCEKYLACDAAGATTDPWVCASSAAATLRVTCEVFQAGGSLCGTATERSWLLPNVGTSDCTTWVLGLQGHETEQEHYIVGVGGPEEMPAPTTTSCEVRFHVVASQDLAPQEDDVFLWSRQASGFELWHLRLLPSFAAVCPMLPMTCVVMP